MIDPFALKLKITNDKKNNNKPENIFILDKKSPAVPFSIYISPST
jgi:hypothetical protein